jgi:hypothetical protein
MVFIISRENNGAEAADHSLDTSDRHVAERRLATFKNRRLVQDQESSFALPPARSAAA